MTSLRLSEPYQPRAIRYLGQWGIAGFRMKAYGITCRGERPARELCDAARRVAARRIAASASVTPHYSVGFVGIHEGKDANFVFVDWWANENELHHHVYTASHEDRLDLVYQTPSGVIACAWDLYVMAFERDAWVSNVLRQCRSPDIAGYLDTTLNCDI